MLEVFANGRVALTTRICPARPDSLGLALLAEGGPALLLALDAWELEGIWEA